MRADMYKVIVERPRVWKSEESLARRLRKDHDGPSRLGMRMGYRSPILNENLSPLRRYLNAQLGRPWSKVYSEICSGIDRRNTVQQHIHQHIHNFIAIHVENRGGRLIDLSRRDQFFCLYQELRQKLYVDPVTGLIRENKNYRRWRHDASEGRRLEMAKIARRRRVIDDRSMHLLLKDVWYRVDVDMFPKERRVDATCTGETARRLITEPRFDVVLRKHLSRASTTFELEDCLRLYGSKELYAMRKRQLASREIRRLGLR